MTKQTAYKDVLDVVRKIDVKQPKSTKLRLRVLHDRVPPLPKDKVPPCDECEAAPCCTIFTVQLTKLEYESGIYGKHAVKFPVEVLEQFQGKMGELVAPNAPELFLLKHDTPQYLLEGIRGAPCPFLGENNRCTIYNDRPLVCRTYTCVGDPRITSEMRKHDSE